MPHRSSALVFALILAMAFVSFSCKKPETQPELPQSPVEAPAETPPPAPKPPKEEVIEDFPSQEVERGPAPAPSVDELNRSGVLATVYFAFDSYDLDAVATGTLTDNARWLRDHPDHAVRVEGHCDERGTIEYNLALGERRASVVRDYLVSLGVDASRIRIVSYGEESPADPGHTEAAWDKNRRAEFVFES